VSTILYRVFVTVYQKSVCKQGEITFRSSLDSQHRKNTQAIYHYNREFAYVIRIPFAISGVTDGVMSSLAHLFS